MKIFAHDPGSVNYGFSVVEAEMRRGKFRFRVLENGLVPTTLHMLKDNTIRRAEKNAYMEWNRKMIGRWKPDAIFAERYMTRGISGPTIETVNMMLGILQSFNLPDRYVPAAVWKNAVTRNGIDLKGWYKFCRTTPHALDAALIGVWAAHQVFGVKDMGKLNEERFESLVLQIEKTSTGRLINRKSRK